MTGELKGNPPESNEHEPRLATELWFREEDAAELQSERVIASVRLGDRTEFTADEKGGYKAGKFVTLKVQKPEGSFAAEYDKEALVFGTDLRTIRDLRENDLAGAMHGESTKEEVVEKLKLRYGIEISEADMVTVTRFKNLEAMKSTMELAEGKALSLAHLPADNPENLDFKEYTVPLIAEDYPAKTAAMWNAAYREFGIDAGNAMMVGDPENTKEILAVFRKDDRYRGGGAGVGFKDEAFKYVDRLDPLAEAIGSINFILKTPEGLTGFNTDGKGYAESLEEVAGELRGKKAVMLGAGGTGNAIAFALAEKGMDVVILNRTVAKAEELVKRIHEHFNDANVRAGGEELMSGEIATADVVVNVSTKGAAGPLAGYSALAPAKMPATESNISENRETAEKNLALLKKDAIVSDIVITTGGTPLLRQANENGFTTLDGIPMVINQGVEAFWIAYSEELSKKGVTKENVQKIMREAARNKK